ncbi:MAG: hypothetical protein RL687_380 [Candidatus Parcubacteria bacterium]|jgi:uncharacterized membrane protein YphA (DoxX/SURF4 family)
MKYLNYLFMFFVGFSPILSSAHVSYVINKDEMLNVAGKNPEYLGHALSNPTNWILMVVTALLVLVLAIFCNNNKSISSFFIKIKNKLSSYHELIPWIIRLALGISLLGAGVSGVLISPTYTDAQVFSLVQTVLGFFFLAGFLLVPTTIVAIFIFLYGILTNAYLIGNMDFLVLAVSFLVFHSARPGIDDIFGISMFKFIKIPRKYLALILRLGLGFAFIYLALYEKLLNPGFSDLVVSQYNLTSLVPVDPAMWVLSAGLVELVLGILIVIGFYTRTVAFVAFLVISLTFFYFKEAVYSHVTLFSALAILAIEGGGLWSVDKKLEEK